MNAMKVGMFTLKEDCDNDDKELILRALHSLNYFLEHHIPWRGIRNHNNHDRHSQDHNKTTRRGAKPWGRRVVFFTWGTCWAWWWWVCNGYGAKCKHKELQTIDTIFINLNLKLGSFTWIYTTKNIYMELCILKLFTLPICKCNWQKYTTRNVSVKGYVFVWMIYTRILHHIYGY